jgi:hypothetical protein
MTAWVNRVIEEALQEHERQPESQVADVDALAEDGTTKPSRKELNDGISQTD